MKNGKFSNTIFSKLRFCWQLPHNFYEISVTICARQIRFFVLHSGHVVVVHNRELFWEKLSQNLLFRKEGQNFYPYPFFWKTWQKRPLEKKTKTLFLKNRSVMHSFRTWTTKKSYKWLSTMSAVAKLLDGVSKHFCVFLEEKRELWKNYGR